MRTSGSLPQPPLRQSLFLLTFFLLLLCILPGPLQAKRTGPPKVPDITLNNVRFNVPNTPDTMGVVFAYDATTGARLWQEKVYTVQINPLLEKDVQWVFVTRMWIHRTEGPGNSMLRLTNERGETFELDPKTGRSMRTGPRQP